MFVGHGLLAFAIVGLVAHRYGMPARRALALGTAAGLFATLPDIDILYGPLGLMGGVSDVGDAVDTFWATGNIVHRGPTHSLLVCALAAGGFAFAARRSISSRLLGGTILSGLVVFTLATSGGLDATVVTAFVLGGIAILAVARRLDLSARAVAVTALVGLLSHPFGDLLTGSPPDLLYPFDAVLIRDRLVLHADGTIHLLGAFAIELAVIWLAVFAYFEITDRTLGANVDRRAGLGAVYAVAILVFPAPTIHSASPFVLSVLSLGLVGAFPTTRTVRRLLPRTVATGLAAVTLAAAAYTVAYLIV